MQLGLSSPASVPAADEAVARHVARWGVLLVVIGAAAVAITSVCYALSPRFAALPTSIDHLREAFAESVPGSGPMWFAGSVGVLGDMAFATGAFALAWASATRGRGAACIGWLFIAVTNIVFTIVDAIVGRVLVRAAVADPTSGVFIAVKSLFDMLFIAGTFGFGVGAVLAMRGERGLGARAAVVLGAAAVPISLLALLGLDLGRLLGLLIAAGSVAFVVDGYRRFTLDASGPNSG